MIKSTSRSRMAFKVYRKIEGSIEGSQFTHCSGIAVRTSSTCSAIYSNGLI